MEDIEHELPPRKLPSKWTKEEPVHSITLEDIEDAVVRKLFWNVVTPEEFKNNTLFDILLLEYILL